MRINYKFLFILCLSVLFVVSAFCALQHRLEVERQAKSTYLVDLTVADRKIKNGMSTDEVVTIVGYEPDEIDRQDKGSVFRWIPAKNQGWLTEMLYDRSIQHSYMMVIVFDANERVIDNASGYQ